MFHMKKIVSLSLLFTVVALCSFAPPVDDIDRNPATISPADSNDHEIQFNSTRYYELFRGKTECAAIEVLSGSFYFNVGGLAASGSLVEAGDNGKIILGFDNKNLNIHYQEQSDGSFRISVN